MICCCSVFMCFFFLMIRRPPRSTQSRSSAASDVYKRQVHIVSRGFGFSKVVFLKLLSRVCSLRRSDIEVILTP